MYLLYSICNLRTYEFYKPHSMTCNVVLALFTGKEIILQEFKAVGKQLQYMFSITIIVKF